MRLMGFVGLPGSTRLVGLSGERASGSPCKAKESEVPDTNRLSMRNRSEGIGGEWGCAFLKAVGAKPGAQNIGNASFGAKKQKPALFWMKAICYIAAWHRDSIRRPDRSFFYSSVLTI